MVYLIAKAKLRKFQDTKLKSSYHFDKTNINNFQFPEFIDSIKTNNLNEIIKQIVKKYIKGNYQPFYREELDDKYDFSNMEILYLLKFYKEEWNLKIPQQDLYFPTWTFTYNLEPLQEEVFKVVAHAYHKLESNYCKWYLNDSFEFSVLEVTYLLHYFVLLYENEKKEDINQPPPTK